MEEYLEQIPQILEDANKQRGKNGESNVSIAEAVIALSVADWWAQRVCNPTFNNGCDES